MEIERINENTIKFYISYMDIEDLGFEREEIWYDRERSEQLFWQMMEEVHHKEDFSVEGPLWIQVQALEKGLEVIVTKAVISKDGDLDMTDDFKKDHTIEESMDDYLKKEYNYTKFGSSENINYLDEGDMQIIVSFAEFEDVIGVSHYTGDPDGVVTDILYHYEDKYYLVVNFDEFEMDENEKEDVVSKLMEYGKFSNISIHVLEEYGKQIFAEEALAQIRKYFKN